MFNTHLSHQASLNFHTILYSLQSRRRENQGDSGFKSQLCGLGLLFSSVLRDAVITASKGCRVRWITIASSSHNTSPHSKLLFLFKDV